MASGKVKWFNNKKGYGFIAQDLGMDVFVHHSSILGTGYHTLNQGEFVNFDLIESDKGPKAENVRRPDARNRRFKPAAASQPPYVRPYGSQPLPPSEQASEQPGV